MISSEPRLDVTLQGVLGKLVNTTHCKVGAVYLFSEDAQSLDLAAVAYDSRDAAAWDEAMFPDHVPPDYVQRCPETPGRVIMALKDRQHQMLGILVLHHAIDDRHVSDDFRAFASKLSGALSVSLETRNLFAAQQRLLDSIIQLLADAIDAKSPYTGGHCERVLELASASGQCS